jgi:hypothetical protein
MCWWLQINGYSYSRVVVIRINVHPVGETQPTRHICISRGQRIATFHIVINRVEQGHCSREKGLPTQSIVRQLTDPWVRTQFLSQDNHWSIGGQSQPSVDVWLLGLSGPYLRHAIGTFNTCSWGSTHRSLTDTGGGYNLRGANFLHLTLWPSQPTVLRFPPMGPVWF